ncbi:MAG: hypothetical protein J7K13_02340 [Thermoplasmata archaeon]|nr:hypothetical protein [Thermoplasmata archaeon]
MKFSKKGVSIGLALIVILSIFSVTIFYISDYYKREQKLEKEKGKTYGEGFYIIKKEFNFSEPTIEINNGYSNVYVKEANLYSINDGRPVVPVNLTVVELPFGSKIIDVNYEYTKPEEISLSNKLSFGSCSTLTGMDADIYDKNVFYPREWLSYHTGGGLSKGIHKTFFVLRVNPVRYNPSYNELQFIQNIKVEIVYKEPDAPLLSDKHENDLLIIAPLEFTKTLEPLAEHKNKLGVKTKIVNLDGIYKQSIGRDDQEKIKYYIKSAVEKFGTKYVLLVGGIKGQTSKWNLPVRYSHVLIPEGTQEVIEPEFISDLYYADIYDSEGKFSSWDSNDNGVFAEWEKGYKDKMDLYPDVYLGRLPCRNKREVKIMVDKIINYEKNKASDDWFKRIILISGDHWDDPDHITEGVLIMEKASEIMSDFEPVKLYATEENKLLVRDINKALNKGAGFAYFCGHGSSTAWGIHYPPDAQGWAPTLTRLGVIPFYLPMYMNFLRNKNKLPVTIVGGCLNGKFDISLSKNLKKGKLSLSGNCWAWKLTSKKGGGSIATIANSGLGTHAMGDADHNSVNDYLEVLDGWLELKFLQLYAEEHSKILGINHGQAITEYLHRFLGNNDEMDTKMVQQWILFGDPSLIIGGYG